LVAQERAEVAISKSSDSGVWRIVQSLTESHDFVTEQPSKGDDKSFSDITTLAGWIEWVERGREYARRT
jgi:hypothetical protein